MDSSVHPDADGFDSGVFGVVLARIAHQPFSGSAESMTQRLDSSIFFSNVPATFVP